MLFRSIASPYFLEVQNIINVLRQTSINGVLAIGMTFVILTRGIDLSVGSLAALAGIVATSFATVSSVAGMPGSPYPAALAIAIGIAVGLLCGAANGAVVTRFRVPPFVVTLGMLSIARGLAYAVTEGRGQTPSGPDIDAFYAFTDGTILGVPMAVIYLLGLAAILGIVLHHTAFGRHVFEIGRAHV